MSGEENKGDLIDILRNLIHQVIRAKPSLHYIIRNARLEAKSPHAQDIAQLWTILQQTLDSDFQVIFIIDGLDECSSGMEQRKFFLNQLSSICLSAKAVTKLMVFSRLHRSELSDLSPWDFLQIAASNVYQDIEILVSTRLQDSVLNKHKEKHRLAKYLVECSDGMILWADLMIRALEAGFFNVDRVLERPLKDLEAVYGAIILRLSESETHSDIYVVLELLLVAARPLRLDELAVGVALLSGMSYEDYSEMGNPLQEGEDIVRRNSPLLSILQNGSVQLAHTSLREFLLRPSEESQSPLRPRLARHCFELASSHATIASCLINYLSFDCFRPETLEDQSKFVGSSLFEYATIYLVYHVTNSPPCEKLAQMLERLFESTSGWQWLHRLQAEHDVSFGHLQLMQSELKCWYDATEIDRNLHSILGSLLLFLAQRRHDHSELLPEDHTSRLEAKSALAHSYRWHGKYEEAEEVENQVMETRKRVLGIDHPETIRSMAEVAWAQSRQGHWNKAEPLQVKVFELSMKVFGAESLDTLRSMTDLAATYHHQGRWGEAEQLEVEVMETSKRVLGADHLDTLTSMDNLASTYEKQGRWLEAETLHLQVIDLYTMLLRAEHPHTLASMNNLALTYGSQGRWNEAEQLHLQVMETRKRVSGAEHPETLRSMNNLALMYTKQGRWNEAEELQVQVMEMRRLILGIAHPDTLTCMGNLATTYHKQRRLAEAEHLQTQVVETRITVLGAEHPHTLSSMSGLALTYLFQERCHEAEKLQVQVLETRKRILGEEHPHTLSSMNNLASTYSTQKRWSESEKLHLHAVETGKMILGAEHPSTLTSMNNLAETYRSQGHWVKAEELQVRVLETRKRLLEMDHPDMLTSMNNLAMTYKGANRMDEAIELMESVVALSTRRIGAEHPNTVKSARNLNEWLESRSTSTSLSS
jgi:tetratricopeptide (TPR) repeat protein